MSRKGKCFGRKVRSLLAILLSVSFLAGDISVSLAAEQTGTDASVEVIDTTETSDISESDSQSTVSENQAKEDVEEMPAEGDISETSGYLPLTYSVGKTETITTDEGDVFYQSIPFSYISAENKGSLDVAIANKSLNYDDYLTRATYTGNASTQYYLNWRLEGSLKPDSHSEKITVYYNGTQIDTWSTSGYNRDYWWVSVGQYGTGRYKVEVQIISSSFSDGSLTNSFEFLYRDEKPVIGDGTVTAVKNDSGNITAYDVSWGVTGTHLKYQWYRCHRNSETPDNAQILSSETGNNIRIAPTAENYPYVYYLQVSNYGNDPVTSRLFKFRVTCTADLYANGGTCEEDTFQFINMETEEDEFPVAEKEGYDFVGWCTDLSDPENTMYNINKFYGSSVTFYAVYEPKTYEIYYYDLSQISSRAEMTFAYFEAHEEPDYEDTFTYGEAYKIPSDMQSMSKYGYDFYGWYINGDKDNILTNGKELEYTDNIFLLPLYIPRKSYPTFDANGGSFYQEQYDEDADEDVYTEVGDKITVEELYEQPLQFPGLTLYRKGYVFDGWYTRSSCEAGYEATSADVYRYTTTYYAKWSPRVYTVYFNDANYNFLKENKTVLYGERYGQLPKVEKKGAYFSGWYRSSYGGSRITEDSVVGVSNELQDSVNYQNSNIYLYPHFTTVTKDVYINTNGGTVMENEKPVIKNVLTLPIGGYCGALPVVEKEGYVFAGWHADSVTGSLVTDDSYLSSVSFTTLVAAWVPEESTDLVQVTFNTDSNDSSNTVVTKVKGQTYGTMPQPVRTGYYFAGWYTQHNGQGTYVGKNTTVSTTDSTIDLYAKWTPRRYKISFSSDIPLKNVSSAGSLSKQMDFGDYYSLPNVTAKDSEKYHFLGWYTADGVQVTSGTTRITEAKDHTLYAKFYQSLVLLTMDTKGGTFIADADNEYEYTYPIGAEKWEIEINSGAFSDYYDASLPPVARTGYTFAGWKKADGSVFTKDTYMSSDTVVNATWIANQYTVTFQANGGSCSETTRKVAYNTAVGNLPTATRTGYKLSGWSVNGVMVNAGMLITGDVILTAVWEKQNTTTPSVQPTQQPSSNTTTNTTTNAAQTPKTLAKPVITIKPIGKKGKNQVKISWKKVTGAKRYIIYRSTDKKKYQEYKTVTATSYVDKSRKEGKNYYYKVKAVSGSQETVKLKVVSKKTSVKLSWEKEENTVYYDIYRAVVGKTGYQKIKTTKSLKYTDKKLNKKKKYAYRIEAKKNYKESSASNIESCKTDIKIKLSGKKFVWDKKGFPDGAEVYVYQVNNNKAKLWKKVKVKTGKVDVSSIKPQKFKFALVYPDGKKKKTICEKTFKSRHM